ncbi:MAG: GNAT family N-acetyltransferase [Byssovorax sp.]
MPPSRVAPLFERLFANYLAFLARYRDTVERKDGMILVDSTSPEHVCVILEDAPGLDAVPERFRVARLLPWSRLGETDLLARGFVLRGSLAYMRLTGGGDLAAPPDLAIARVLSNEAMDVFTEIQTRAYLAPGDSYETWYARLRARNGSNLHRDELRFYVASREGVPASVLLTVLEQRTLGIYGVGALPAERNRGTSTALLAHAIRDGRAQGADTVTLQALAGAYAQSLYEKLGFETAFVSTIFEKAAPRSPTSGGHDVRGR